MKRRHFLESVAIGTAGCAWSQSQDAVRPIGANSGDRPNVLLILTDQQYAGMLSCAGNPWVHTPAMDSLAAHGVRFEKAYSINPVCAPSRTGMFTGDSPGRFGLEQNSQLESIHLPAEVQKRTLGTLFRDNGYETAYGGKKHLPDTNESDRESDAAVMKSEYGFDEIISANSRDKLSTACVEFLKRPHEKPFLLVASFLNPHDICHYTLNNYNKRARSTPPYREGSSDTSPYAYLAAALQKPEGVSDEQFMADYCPPLRENFEYQMDEPEAVRKQQEQGPERWRMSRWAYCRLTERVDREISPVLQTLRELGLDQNTVVVFTSDHGEMDSAHHRSGKSFFYEEANRVPFIVSGSCVAVPGRTDRENLVSSGLDIIPTLCDFAGIKPPPECLGRSVRGLVEGQVRKMDRAYVASETTGGRMVCSGRYKYCVYSTGERREQLVDLEKDPGELHNVAGDPAYAEELQKHREYMREWVTANKDTIAAQYIIK